MPKYDYLIVGAGLFGATFAYLAKQQCKTCLVIDRRPHIGGNAYCENVDGINVHKYGAHIFHTSDKKVWNFVNSLVEFNRYTNSPVAIYRGKTFNLPFNMNTFAQMWGIHTPDEAKKIIEEQRKEITSEPKNLEEQAISLVGRDIYEALIKGYTEKQWGRSCADLPAFIIKRLPVRYIYDNNYFDDPYQGIPIGGYNALTAKLLEGIEVHTGTDYFQNRAGLDAMAGKTVFTGSIDEYYGYKLGRLEYRTVRFETEDLPTANFQGNAVVNYTEREVPYTRVIEHKHFEMFGAAVDACPHTVISKEYSSEWKPGMEPFYPVNDEKNNRLAAAYRELAASEKNVIFGGRLAEYKYYDMDKVIASAMTAFAKENE